MPEPKHVTRSQGAPSSSGRPAGANRLGELSSKLIAPALAILAAVVVWWGVVRIFEIPDYLLPAPEVVAARIVPGDFFAASIRSCRVL